MNANIYGGSTLVLLPRFEPAAVLETMKRERVNFWTGVPTMFWALTRRFSACPFPAFPTDQSRASMARAPGRISGPWDECCSARPDRKCAAAMREDDRGC